MEDFLPTLVLVAAGVLGYGLQRAINGWLDRRGERRASEIEYLTRAFKALALFKNRVAALGTELDDGTIEIDFDLLANAEREAIELAVTDAALYGSEPVLDAASGFVNSDDWDPTELMVALRKDLRRRLGYSLYRSDEIFFVGMGRSSTGGNGRTRDRPSAAVDPSSPTQDRENNP